MSCGSAPALTLPTILFRVVSIRLSNGAPPASPPTCLPPVSGSRHTRTECDPSNYDKVHRKPRCPVGGCKEKLTTINSYTCRECGVTVCLKHRLAADHKCVGRAAAAASSAHGRLNLSQSWRRMFSVGGTSGAAAASIAAPRQQQQQQVPRQQPAPVAAGGGSSSRRPTVAQKAAAVAAKTKDSIQSQLQQYRQQRKGGPPGAAGVVDLTGSSPTATPNGAEQCPQCGVRFATVQQLIEHAEAAHSGGWSSGAVNMQQQQHVPPAGGLERCPHCGREFADAVQLVAHVEQQHAAEAATTCVCS